MSKDLLGRQANTEMKKRAYRIVALIVVTIALVFIGIVRAYAIDNQTVYEDRYGYIWINVYQDGQLRSTYRLESTIGNSIGDEWGRSWAETNLIKTGGDGTLILTDGCITWDDSLRADGLWYAWNRQYLICYPMEIINVPVGYHV